MCSVTEYILHSCLQTRLAGLRSFAIRNCMNVANHLRTLLQILQTSHYLYKTTVPIKIVVVVWEALKRDTVMHAYMSTRTYIHVNLWHAHG